MPSEKEESAKTIDLFITLVAVVGALYHLISTQFLFQTVLEHQNNHFAFCVLMVLLVSLKKAPRRWPLILVLILLGLVSTGYVKIFFIDLQQRVGFPTAMDRVIGIILIVVALETSRQAFGLVIPVLYALAIAYNFFGHYLPEPFYHYPLDLAYILSNLSSGLQ